MYIQIFKHTCKPFFFTYTSVTGFAMDPQDYKSDDQTFGLSLRLEQ